MPVIALTQEMGSLAKDVAVELGATLNLAVMKHEVVDHVADKMHVSTSLVKRLREGKSGLVERLRADQAQMALYTAEELFDLASRGNVVLRGWGASCLLRPVPHVVTVRITRSFDKRVQWLMGHLETDDRDFAEEEVRRSDTAHAARMHQQFGVTWGDPVLYDLVLNTDRLSIPSCVELIRQACARPEFQETQASRQLLADLTLATRARAALKSHEATRHINITVEADRERLILAGIVLNTEERGQVEQIALGVNGVGGVDNRLRVMTPGRVFTYAKT